MFKHFLDRKIHRKIDRKYIAGSLMFEREVIWMMEVPMKGWSSCWGQLRTRSRKEGVCEKIFSAGWFGS